MCGIERVVRKLERRMLRIEIWDLVPRFGFNQGDLMRVIGLVLRSHRAGLLEAC
jgi:hypothetical protein